MDVTCHLLHFFDFPTVPTLTWANPETGNRFSGCTFSLSSFSLGHGHRDDFHRCGVSGVWTGGGVESADTAMDVCREKRRSEEFRDRSTLAFEPAAEITKNAR